MSWFQRCKAAVAKFGVGPAKFLLKTVLPAAVPGSGVVVEVADRLLSLVDAGTPEERFPDIATEAERNTVGQILAEFEGRLADLAEQLLEREDDPPEKLARLVVQEIKKDREIEAALRDIAGMVARFDRLEAQNRELLRAAHQGIDLQEIGLAIARRQETLVLDFIADQRAAKVQLRELADSFAKLNSAIADLTARPAEALPKLRQLEVEQPRSAAVREAVAVGATFAFDLDLAASSLERAVELRPDDKPLAELCRQVTTKTRGIGGDSSHKVKKPETATGPEFRVGNKIGDWKLLTLLGKGGFGQVFKAKHELNGQVRALKVLLPHLITDPHFDANFRREIVVLCGLGKLPHVVQFDDFNKDDAKRCWYFTMEYIEGESLQTRLLRGPLPPAEAVALFTKLAGPGGLATVHEKGIVHRDIKPANILLTADGTPKLVDFGVAMQFERDEKTKTGGHTVMFASPEQLRGFAAEKPSDVYSLVGCLWYAVTKQEPGLFDADAMPPELLPLRKLVDAALHPRPKSRPADADAVLALLKEIDPASLTPKPAVVAKQVAVVKPQRVKLPAFPPGQWSEITATPFATLRGHEHTVNGVAFSADGRWLGTSSDDEAAKIWSLVDLTCVATLLCGDASYCNQVAFSPDSQRIATANRDACVRMWSFPETRIVTQLGRHGNNVMSVAFSPDGHLLATASVDNTARLWSMADGRCVATLSGHTNSVYAVAFSSDGRLVATASVDNTAKLWAVADGKCLATLAGHGKYVRGVSFSPDGKLLATGSDDNTAKLWSVPDGKSVGTLTGHGSNVCGVAFRPDGRLLATAGGDSTTKLWTVPDGKCVGTLTGHGNGIYGVSFSPDGRVLATASSDKTAKLWLLHNPAENPNWAGSKPRHAPRPRLHLAQSRDGVAYPGEFVWLQLGVENIGQGELSQLWAEVKSETPALDGLTATFGRIDTKQRLDRCLAVVLPADATPGELTAELVFHEANGSAPPAQTLTWEVRPLPRPDFPTTCHLEAEIPGKPPERRAACKRREIIDVVVTMTNLTGDDLPDLELVLTVVKVPTGVRITGDRASIGTLNDDNSAEARVGFTVDANAHLGPAKFEVRVVSGDGRTFAVLPVETTIG